MASNETVAGPLAALVSVAGKHGVDLTIEALRSSYVTADAGMASAALVAVAHDAGLEGSVIRPKWRELPRLFKVLPAIVRLKDGGAVVLLSVVEDPQVGQVVLLENPEAPDDAEVALDEAHFAELWNGEIILIKQRRAFGDEDQPFGFAWLVGQVLREKRLFREIAIASIINTFRPPRPGSIPASINSRRR